MLRDKLKSFWNRVSPGLVGLTLFIAFWQFRYPLYSAYIGQRYFEYGSFNLYAVDLLALAVVIGCLAVGSRPARLEKAAMGWGMAALAWMAISILWADAWVPAVIIAAEFWLWALFAYFAVQLIVRGAGWIVGGALVSGVIGLAQYLANHSVGLQFFGESIMKPEELGRPVVIDNGQRQLRAAGLTQHPNILGGVMLWGWHWLWLQVVELKRSSWVVWLLSAFIVAVLVLSWTRSAWVAGIATVLVALLWARSQGYRKLTGVLVAGLFAAAVILVSQHNIVAARLWVGEPVALEQNSVDDRLASISSWKEVIQGNWLMGVGAGNYPSTLAALHPDWAEWDIYPVHNIYLLWVAELGLVGLLLAVGFMVAVIWHIQSKKVATIRIIPLLGWLIMGLFDHWPLSIHQGYVGLFLALALIFAEGDVS